MALPINIPDAINRRVVENARVEHRRSWSPETLLHSICAFAYDIDNWSGGYVNKAARGLIESGKVEYTEPYNPRSSIQKLRLVKPEDNYD